jgi:hypothetical protein
MSASYIGRSFKVLRPQFDAIENALVGLNNDTKHLVKHILVSTLLQRRELDRGDGFAHVPSETIRRELPNARWSDARHLLDATDYSKVDHRARGYRVKPEVEQAFLEAVESITTAEYLESDKVDIFSGRVANRRAQSQYHDGSRNPEPKLIVEAMKVLSANQVPFAPEAIESHLDRLKKEC